MNHLIQSLEPRRLMSTSFIDFGSLRELNFVPHPVHESVGSSQQVVIAHIPRLKDLRDWDRLTGTIDWGDGSAADGAAFVQGKRGGFDVIGAHDYTLAGKYPIKGTFSIQPIGAPGEFIPQWIIQDKVATTATVTPIPATLTETATQKFTAVIASFHQPTVDVIFTAKINWGDGTTSVGTITGDGPANGNWQVTAAHTYKRTGVYKVHTYIYSHVVGFKGPGFLSQNLLTLIHVMGAA